MRRAAKAIENKTGNVLVPGPMVEQLLAAQRYFLAIVKSQGRVRITKAELEALREGDRIKSARSGDGIVFSFEAAEEPHPQEAAAVPQQESTP